MVSPIPKLASAKIAFSQASKQSLNWDKPHFYCRLANSGSKITKNGDVMYHLKVQIKGLN
jgi:hypothetical protein